MRPIAIALCATVVNGLSSVFAATSERAPEDELLGKLPEIFAKSAEHYKALDAAATPLMKDEQGEFRTPHGWRIGKVAMSHADVTMKHHYRLDGGCYHVLDYDQETKLLPAAKLLPAKADLPKEGMDLRVRGGAYELKEPVLSAEVTMTYRAGSIVQND